MDMTAESPEPESERPSASRPTTCWTCKAARVAIALAAEVVRAHDAEAEANQYQRAWRLELAHSARLKSEVLDLAEKLRLSRLPLKKRPADKRQKR